MTQTHIRRDGGWLCKNNPKSYFYKKDNHIKFSYANQLNLSDKNKSIGFCSDCLKAYFNILSKLKNPIIK